MRKYKPQNREVIEPEQWIKDRIYRAIIVSKTRRFRKGFEVYIQFQRYVDCVGLIWDYAELESDFDCAPIQIGHWYPDLISAERGAKTRLNDFRNKAVNGQSRDDIVMEVQ